MNGLLILDVVLACGAVVTAGLSLFHPRVFAGVILFVVFGALLALIWLRLQAPDVALAEAAVGAGITGILLMVTLARLAGAAKPEQSGLGPSDNKAQEGQTGHG